MTVDERPDERIMLLRGRLTWLRPAEPDDIPHFVRWLNDERTAAFLALRAPLGRALEERWFERMIEAQGHDGWFFVICRLGSAEPIGTIGLFGVDLTNGSAGIGITIGDPADTGHGLGSDALEALLDFGFGELRLERLWLDVYDFNDRARRVYDRAGFVFEGTLRHAIYRRRRHVDVQRMSILRAEWAARRAADPFPGPPAVDTTAR